MTDSGGRQYPNVENYYVLTHDRRRARELLLAAGRWGADLHGEAWVYDQGYWQKSAELYRSVMQAEWANVILAPAMKRALIDDHLSFFAARDTYARLRVPWKRGVIYHGPPGNGKTISIKATMHMLYDLKTPVPTLYVRSLFSVRDIAAVSVFFLGLRADSGDSTKALSIQSNRSSAKPASLPPATSSSRT